MAKILIIEDDYDNARLVTRVLERSGHEVIHTSTGLQGLKVASKEAIDLILLDLGLPDVGGHVIARLIDRVQGSVPIVAISGHTDPDIKRRAVFSGCVGYITKPIDTRVFPDQIAAFLNTETDAQRLLVEDDADDFDDETTDSPAETDSADESKQKTESNGVAE